MESTIEVIGLSKSYGEKRAVSKLNLEIKKGETFGLLGANGAGKTTTIECILGTKKHEEGSIKILGYNPLNSRRDLFQRIGVQFQDSHYQDKITVSELCELTQVLYKNPKDYKELLKTLGLQDLVKQSISELSGGERQRLFVVLALIPNPELVFLDELTTGLDARARRDVWRYLEKLKKEGITILLTSHYMDEIEVLCDRICILKKGEAIYTGSLEEAIKQSPYDNLEDAYLWYTDEEDVNNESI